MSTARPKMDHRSYPRASAFYALSNCPASFALSQASGEEPPTPHSDHGTEVHQVISGALQRDKVDEGIRDEADALKQQADELIADWAETDPETGFTWLT